MQPAMTNQDADFVREWSDSNLSINISENEDNDSSDGYNNKKWSSYPL